MALRPSFSIEDVRHQMDLAQNLFDRTIEIRLKYLGEQCVNMSRDSIGINSSAFPVEKYEDATKDPKALKQRVLSESELSKNKVAPVFGDYLDDTGNLRASIGYFVGNDGAIINAKGDLESTVIALKAISDVPKGWALVVVAGMNYAAAVEANGYNVISSSELYAKSELPNILQKLSDQLKNSKKL